MTRLLAIAFAAAFAGGCSRPLPRATPPRAEPPRPAVSSGAEAGDAPPASVTAEACLDPRASEVLDHCASAPEAPARSARQIAAAELALAEAERAFAASDWRACAAASDEAARTLPDRARRAEAAYLAMLCLTNEVEAAEEGERRRRSGPRPVDPLAPRPLTEEERALDRAYARRLCLDPEGDEWQRVLYRRARVYYEANHWSEAAALFRDLVAQDPGHELAPYAANLYLDSVNALGTVDRSRSAACRALLADEVRRFLDLEPLMRDAELEAQLEALECSLDWSAAQTLLDGGRAREAGEVFLRLADRLESGCGDGAPHGADEALWNAATAFEAAGDSARAASARRALAERFPSSPLLR